MHDDGCKDDECSCVLYCDDPAFFNGCGTFFQCHQCVARPAHSLQHGDHARRSVITSCNPTNTGLAPRDEGIRKRGRKGGVRARNKQTKFKPYLLTVILGNVQSSSNKMDEVHANVHFSDEFRTCCLLCFSETWLNETITNTSMCVEGFPLYRGDRTKESENNNNNNNKTGGWGKCVCKQEMESS